MKQGTRLIKSPFNYTGGKYKLLPQILPYFPERINTFIDLFCGGCDVSLNVKAKRIIANDANPHIAAIFNEFKRVGEDFALQFIDNRIAGNYLKEKDKEAYLAFRDEYNHGARRPLDLFVLIAYCFNYQLRFNRKGEFNSSVGKMHFSSNMRKNLIAVFERIDEIEFISKDFRDIDMSRLTEGDFVYADPPYSGTCAVYNETRYGLPFWKDGDDSDLMAILDGLAERNIRFLLSNIRNEQMCRWAGERGYGIKNLEKTYSFSNYQRKKEDWQEILIGNLL